MRRSNCQQVAGPPQLRLQPRHQFLQRERLHQVVVGAAAQAMNPVVQAAARGQDQNRDRIVGAPDLAQQLEPVAVGQAEVENQRGVKGAPQNAARLFDRRQDVGLVARGPQALHQEFGKFLIILDDQQSHCCYPTVPPGLALGPAFRTSFRTSHGTIWAARQARRGARVNPRVRLV